MTCISCNTPTANAERCERCLAADGSPLPFDAVRDRLAAELVDSQGLDPNAARASATAMLDRLPAWRSAPALAEGGTPPRLSIRLMAGDVEVRGNAQLQEPRLEDDDEVQLVRTPDGWVVCPRGDGEPNRHGWFVDGSCCDVEIEVPTFFTDVAIEVQSGDIEVCDLPARITARLQAGDVEIADVTGLDLRVDSGDVEISGKFTSGEHHIQVMAGDIELNLDRGSDLQLALSLQSGDLEVDGLPYRVDHSLTGSRRLEATLGEGQARLSVSLMAGDVELSAR